MKGTVRCVGSGRKGEKESGDTLLKLTLYLAPFCLAALMDSMIRSKFPSKSIAH